MSMNAALTSLYILTAPDMPKQLYLEEGIEAILECLRFNLMSNILAFSDIRILQASRPDLLLGEGAVKLPFKISRLEQPCNCCVVVVFIHIRPLSCRAGGLTPKLQRGKALHSLPDW